MCIGEWDVDRKKIAGSTPEECKYTASRDSQCSDTMYHCTDYHGVMCGCVIKGQSCRTQVNHFVDCSVEMRKEVESGLLLHRNSINSKFQNHFNFQTIINHAKTV